MVGQIHVVVDGAKLHSGCSQSRQVEQLLEHQTNVDCFAQMPNDCTMT